MRIFNIINSYTNRYENRKNKFKEWTKDKPLTVWHGTDRSNMPSINYGGLIPGKELNRDVTSSSPEVYTTTSKRLASIFADMNPNPILLKVKMSPKDLKESELIYSDSYDNDTMPYIVKSKKIPPGKISKVHPIEVPRTIHKKNKTIETEDDALLFLQNRLKLK